MKKEKNISGFSLIELSIVILIMSVIISGTFIFFGNASFKSKALEDEKRIDVIDQAIKKYFVKHGHLPCPASRIASLNTALFGAATDCSLASAPTGTVHANGNLVRIGALPTRELGLDDKFMFDSYNNRFTYAVSRLHATTAANFLDNSLDSNVININHINITTQSQTNINNIKNDDGVMYVIVGHGSNANGATSYSGTLVACDTGVTDGENCDLDENFIDIYKLPGHFDQNIRWSTKQQLMFNRLQRNNNLGLNNITRGRLALFSYRVSDSAASLPSVSGSNLMPLNHTHYNNLSNAKLDTANSQATLGPGHYIMRAYSTTCAVDGAEIMVESSVSSQRIQGIATFADSTASDCANNYAVGYMHLQETENIRVYQYTELANAIDGLGRSPASGLGNNISYVFIEIIEL